MTLQQHGLTIRGAAPRDRESLRRFYREGFDSHARHEPTDFLSVDEAGLPQVFDAIIDRQGDVVLVAEIDCRVVGFVHFGLRELAESPITPARRYIAVHSLLVDEPIRKRGVGRALMEEVHRWGREQGAAEIELKVWEFNKPAMHFYGRLGYVTVTRTLRLLLGSPDLGQQAPANGS